MDSIPGECEALGLVVFSNIILLHKNHHDNLHELNYPILYPKD